MKNILNQIKIIVLGIIVAVGFSYAFAWTGPTSTPPNGNVAAPLNVSSSTQYKLGSLVLNAATPIQNAIGLTVFGTSSFNGVVQIADGTQGAGKVLTSDANGNASWATISGGSGSEGFSNQQVFRGSGTFTVPSGVTKIMVQVWGAGGNAGSYEGGEPNNGLQVFSGAGGGYAESILSVTPGAQYAVVAAPAPPYTVYTVSSDNQSSSPPGPGGTSSFGSVSATGGDSSVNLDGSNTSAGGCGVGGSLDVCGGPGTLETAAAEIGGAGAFGGSGGGINNNGNFPGGGGSANYGTGAAGLVIVWW